MSTDPRTPLGLFVHALTGGETAVVKMDDYDDCVLGLAFRCATEPVLVYDRDAVLGKLMGDGEMTYDEAEEWIEFNMAGAWVGEQTPFLLRRFQPEVWQELLGDAGNAGGAGNAADA